MTRSLSLSEWLDRSEWIDRGIVLGAMGGLGGFFTSGLVHYNWGDSEVVMIFYFIVGLSLTLERSIRDGFVERPSLTLRV